MVDENRNQTDQAQGPADLPAGPHNSGASAAAGEAAPSLASAADDQLNRDIDELRAELDQAKDRALRFQAELDNYRKRVSRQMDDERRYAQVPLIRDLLPVLDNVARAVTAAEKAADSAGLLEGFRLVAKQLQGVLERHHCTPIQALHQPFDPHQHEAIMQQPSGDVPPNTVLGVAQAGYRVHDRVVRPAQVIVSRTVPGEPASPGDGQAESKPL